MSSLSYNEIRARLAQFSERWKDATDEHAEAKSFWDELFNCYGTLRRHVAAFEAPIKKTDGNPGFIDLLWKGKLVVEHKSRGKDLKKAKEQAQDYIARLRPADRPRYLVVCDFHEFQLFDLHNDKESIFFISELYEKAELLGFIAGYELRTPSDETPVNLEAVEKLGNLYEAMRAGGYPDHELQLFLVRILFCLFAEDTGIFEPDEFTRFIDDRTSEDGSDLGIRLSQFFEVLNQESDRRQLNLDEYLKRLPFVGGELFSDRLTFAEFDSRSRKALLDCMTFDWAQISPAIFGSLFQGVMDSKERRSLGAHYTSEEQILLLINPLFMDGLRAEFSGIISGPERGREQKLIEFQHKLGRLKFFDPACGCGNFLIITYRELRRLELDVLKRLYPESGQLFDISAYSKISVSQFYGIEIEEFPAQIARVAMWLIDHIMNVELGYSFGKAYVNLPLNDKANIVHGNAMELDWKEVLPPSDDVFILGNPPFIGSKFQTDQQKEEIAVVSEGERNFGILDYVAGWYLKSAGFIQGTNIRCAFVSTNSITQGEQVGVLWNMMLKMGVVIQFAHRTFKWISEAKGKANVHVVIVGFGLNRNVEKVIYDHSSEQTLAIKAKNINPYLIDADNLVVMNSSRSLCDAPSIGIGNKPIDGGYYLFTPIQKEEFVRSEPKSERFFRRWIGSEELINGIERWCLWLGDASPSELKEMPWVLERIQNVKSMRLDSKSAGTRKLAETPTRFHVENIPTENYLVIPSVSSERRPFIPIAFLDANTLASNLVLIVNPATLFHFGILSSTMHMAWMRTVAGRLKSDYRYSAKLVYNNFPWPETTTAQQDQIAECGQKVLDARAEHPNATLADLYDPLTMPPNLVKAHADLDRAVDKAYRKEAFRDEPERIAFLFEIYKKLVSEKH